MTDIQRKIKKIAEKYHIQIIYAFGSRAKEIARVLEGKKLSLTPSRSDLDIGIMPDNPLRVKEIADISVFFEDLFDLPRVDIVVVPAAPIPLAYQIVTGELLYVKDDRWEAEYQLMIMRMMADLRPHLRMKREMILRA